MGFRCPVPDADDRRCAAASAPHARSLQSSMTCTRCCVWRKDEAHSRRRRSSTGAPCSLPRKAAHGQAVTEPNAERAAKSISRWTRWAICWHCTSRLPTNRNALRSLNWPPSAGSHEAERNAGVWQSRLHGRRACRTRTRGRQGAGSGQTSRSHERLCAAAAPLSGGAFVCLGSTFSAACQGLRAAS